MLKVVKLDGAALFVANPPHLNSVNTEKSCPSNKIAVSSELDTSAIA